MAIVGASGVGKTLLAEELHRVSGRGKCVRVSVPNIPPSLLPARFFGHARGAFTDAKEDRPGLVEEADGGVLFVDELQDAGAEAQLILRDIAERRPVSRVGEYRPYIPNCRIIVGSQVPLMDLVRQHGLREDLAWRLMVESIVIPPLTEHLEDLADLVPSIVALVAAREKIQPLGVSGEAYTILARYDWPGNVRELENALLRAVIDAQEDGVIECRHLPRRVFGGSLKASQSRTGGPTAEELAGMLLRLGTRKAVAAHFGVCERTVARWIARFGTGRAA